MQVVHIQIELGFGNIVLVGGGRGGEGEKTRELGVNLESKTLSTCRYMVPRMGFKKRMGIYSAARQTNATWTNFLLVYHNFVTSF